MPVFFLIIKFQHFLLCWIAQRWWSKSTWKVLSQWNLFWLPLSLQILIYMACHQWKLHRYRQPKTILVTFNESFLQNKSCGCNWGLYRIDRKAACMGCMFSGGNCDKDNKAPCGTIKTNKHNNLISSCQFTLPLLLFFNPYPHVCLLDNWGFFLHAFDEM